MSADPYAALAELDPVMAELIERDGRLSLKGRRRGPKPDPFGALVSIVVAQQLSSKAARTIDERIEEAFGDRRPNAAEAARATRELRGAGLSGRKVEYIQGIAQLAESGELDLDALEKLPDDQVIERLSALRGLGRWSGEMYLISYLERPDVLSGGDLGIRRGIQVALGLSEMPSAEETEEIGERWRPQRTLASFYLWREASVAPPS